MKEDKESIGILGGSFNPVHKGHLAIARSFLDSEYISKLWILLTPDPPHKQDELMAAYSHRMKMLEIAFEDWDSVVISDLETNLPRPSYTLQTLQYLADKCPDKTFYLCIGEDSARHFKKWHRWRDILSQCDLLVAQRTPDSLKLESPIAEHAHIVNHEPVEISSTEIRRKLSEGKQISQLVPAVVEDYIQTHNLYKNAD